MHLIVSPEKISLKISGMEKCIIIWLRGPWLNKNTIANSDFIFKIEISKAMESLNISNSVSIVCHHINRIIDNKN